MFAFIRVGFVRALFLFFYEKINQTKNFWSISSPFRLVCLLPQRGEQKQVKKDITYHHFHPMENYITHFIFMVHFLIVIIIITISQFNLHLCLSSRSSSNFLIISHFHSSTFQKLFTETIIVIICHHQIHSHKSCVCNSHTINSNNPAWYPFFQNVKPTMSSFSRWQKLFFSLKVYSYFLPYNNNLPCVFKTCSFSGNANTI